MGKLDGRVAVITSGSTGIGRGIGEAFLAEGASIVINGRDPEKGAKALKQMNAGDRGHFIRGDVTVREDIDAVVGGAVEQQSKQRVFSRHADPLPLLELSSRPPHLHMHHPSSSYDFTPLRSRRHEGRGGFSNSLRCEKSESACPETRDCT